MLAESFVDSSLTYQITCLLTQRRTLQFPFFPPALHVRGNTW